MLVSDGRFKRAAIPLLCYVLSAFVRLLPYYEIPGLAVRNGWADSPFAKTLYILGFLAIVAITIFVRIWLVQIIMQLIGLVILIICEAIFMNVAEFTISSTTFGFWVNTALMLIYAVCCCIQIGIHIKNRSACEPEY